MHGRNGRMLEPAHDPRFGQETTHQLRPALMLGSQNLDGQITVQPEVPRAVDQTHAAAADFLSHLEVRDAADLALQALAGYCPVDRVVAGTRRAGGLRQGVGQPARIDIGEGCEIVLHAKDQTPPAPIIHIEQDQLPQEDRPLRLEYVGEEILDAWWAAAPGTLELIAYLIDAADASRRQRVSRG